MVGLLIAFGEAETQICGAPQQTRWRRADLMIYVQVMRVTALQV